MVQLQTFAKSDYLLKQIAFILISYRIERKNEKKLFHFFKISKNIILKFSGHALIGQNDTKTSSYWTNFSCDLKRVEMT